MNHHLNNSRGRFGSHRSSSPVTFYYDSSSRLRCTASGHPIQRYATAETLSETLSSSYQSRILNNALKKNELYRHSQPLLIDLTPYDYYESTTPETLSTQSTLVNAIRIRRLPVLPFQHIAVHLLPAARQCAYNLLLDKLISSPGCENIETGGISLCGGIEAG